MCKSDKANECFLTGFNCAQAVFTTFCEELGLEKSKALKIASSFGAGMAHMDETCGAVTGAFMAIGLKFGRTKVEDVAAKEKTYSLVREFSRRFIEIHGSIKCTELLGCNLSTEEGLKKATEEKRFRTFCPKYVVDAAKIVEDLFKK
jgi:C_GCAxxG_C_C family probable redox protein